MRTTTTLILLAAATGMLAACNTTPVDNEANSRALRALAKPTRQLVIPPNADIGIRTQADGTTLLEVVIPEGHPHAATYVSTDPDLAERLRDARDQLGNRYFESTITVDDDFTILAIANAVIYE